MDTRWAVRMLRWGARTVPAVAAAAGAVSWWGTNALLDPDRVVGIALAASCDEAVPCEVPAALARHFPERWSSCVRVRLWGPSSDWPGVWGAVWRSGFGVVGPPQAADGRMVSRDLLVLGGTAPEPGGLTPVTVTLRASLWPEDPQEVGVACQDVDVPGPLGPLPCWRVPPPDGEDGGHWVLFVHGRGSSRAQASRVAPLAATSGWTSLMMSYRNDPDAPRTGRYRLGDDEWEDLEAAMAYALAQGAERVVLVGFSMGGSIVQSFLRRSPYAEYVVGIVLDAPVVDWAAVLRSMGRRLPAGRVTAPALVPLVMMGARWRAQIDWRRLDVLRSAAELRTPILLFHGADDLVVPVGSSDQLAEARPDLVTYVRVEGAGHVTSWNHDPDRYDAAIGAFLGRCASGEPAGAVTSAS